jgi:hypothetical protein
VSILPPSDDGIQMTKHCFVYCGPERCDCGASGGWPDDWAWAADAPLVPQPEPKKPLVVNLFGGPGAGKTTMASGLFYFLKCARMNVEFAHEYAKELHFGGRMKGAASLQDQIYIFAKQRSRVERLLPHSDIVVTDCPVLLGANYYPELFPDSFRELLLWSFAQHNTLNLFVKRVQPYAPIGRRQSAEEADAIAEEMMKFLSDKGVAFETVSGDEDGIEQAMALIKERM